MSTPTPIPTVTGIKNADELLTLARAYDLNVTVETTSDTQTTHTIRISIKVPTLYAGTDQGRTIESTFLTMRWVKPSRKTARGSLELATFRTGKHRRVVQSLRGVRDDIEQLGEDAKQYALETAPLPDDAVDAPHTVHDSHNDRHNEDGAITTAPIRFLPQPAPAEDPYKALLEALYAADMSNAIYDVTASQDDATRQCPAQAGKPLRLAVGIKHGDGARVEGNAERFTVDWRGVKGGPGDIVFTYQRRADSVKAMAEGATLTAEDGHSLRILPPEQPEPTSSKTAVPAAAPAVGADELTLAEAAKRFPND
ncbi:hypothetical protein [Streptomyces sp. NPDC055140]